MAVTATAVSGRISQGHMKTWDVKATADGDTTATIAHGLTFVSPSDSTRCKVTITPLTAKGIAQGWVFTSIDATNLVLTKTSTAQASGDADNGLRVYLEYVASPYA